MVVSQTSRFAFAQKQIERTADVSAGRAPPDYAYQHFASQTRVPAPTKATLVAVPRVVGPRPPQSQCAICARREPALAAPKAVHPLPTWLTRFEDYEEELLSEFCPSSVTRYPRNSTLPATVRVEPSFDRALEPLDATPLLGLQDSDSGDPDNDIVDGAQCSEEDEDFSESNTDYNLSEFDTASDFESDYDSFRSFSGSSTPASSCWADAFDWPSPYQWHASGAALFGSPPQYSPITSSESHASFFSPLNFWTSQPSSLLASPDPLSLATILTPPPQSSAAAPVGDTVDDSFIKAEVDRLISKMEEWELGYGLTSEATLDSYGGDVEEWSDWSDLADYTFPVPPQWP